MSIALELSDNALDQLADKLARRLIDHLPQSAPLTDDSILDSREAIDYLRLPSLDALHRLSAAGTIPTLQRTPGGRLRFRKRDLDGWLAGAT